MTAAAPPKNFHVLVDLLAGSCGKGAVSPRMAEILDVSHVSSHNLPNAGHTAVFGTGPNAVKFVSKAIPTPMILQTVCGRKMTGFISPGSGFNPLQLLKEWVECGRPDLIIHDRAVLVLPEHAEAERSGRMSTKHLASTMQGSAAAQVGKMMRNLDCKLARDLPEVMGLMIGGEGGDMDIWKKQDETAAAFFDQVKIVSGSLFRDLTFEALESNGIVHEGSQGYALSLNHGLEWPYTTSRDCDTSTAAAYMAIPPQRVGEVWGLIRAGHMIRVGNVVEDGKTMGVSGGGYPDQQETTWQALATEANMPVAVAESLLKKELTTVTGRLRRVFTESRMGIADAIRTTGTTRLIVNFAAYIDWSDYGKKRLEDLSPKTRAYIDRLEDEHQVPVSMIGTGAEHGEFIWRS
jgi:adenylosuccinate synthase